MAQTPQKVVMISGNDVIIDARVMKYAQTVAGWGLDVTAVGIAGKAHRGSSTIGPLKINTPPVGASLSAYRRSVLKTLTPWYSDSIEQRDGKRRLAYARREVAGKRGAVVRAAERDGVLATPPSIGSRQRALRVAQARLRLRGLVHRTRGIKLALQRRLASRRTPDIGVGGGRARKMGLYRLTGQASWRRQLKRTLDQEMVLGPLLDRLEPDLIHVHDVFMLGVASRAAQRASSKGRSIPVIYDAHEYLRGLPAVDVKTVAAYCDLEAEFIAEADRVITVSPPLATLLQRDHRLAALPDVVLNAPVDGPVDADIPGVRELLGLADDVPLLLYVGGVNRARGVSTAVEALTLLPGVHLAVVANENVVTTELTKQAEALGVGDRYHLLPYVAPELVPSYIRSVSVGISPLLRVGNHDVALTNKFWEYLAAGLPIVTSDTPAQADMVKSLDLGAVHTAGDVGSFVSAVTDTLADRDRLAKRIGDDADLRHQFSWAAQAEIIRGVYTEVLGTLPDAAWAEGATRITHLVTEADVVPDSVTS